MTGIRLAHADNPLFGGDHGADMIRFVPDTVAIPSRAIQHDHRLQLVIDTGEDEQMHASAGLAPQLIERCCSQRFIVLSRNSLVIFLVPGRSPFVDTARYQRSSLGIMSRSASPPLRGPTSRKSRAGQSRRQCSSRHWPVSSLASFSLFLPSFFSSVFAI